MKSFRFTFLFLGFGLIAFFTWALFLPSELRVRESQAYSTDMSVIFAQLSDFSQWEYWFPWKDENSEFFVSGEKAKQGYRLEWIHPEYGKGYLKLVRIVPDSLLMMEMSVNEHAEAFFSEMKVVRKYDDRTEIVWTIYNDEKYTYPLGRVRAFVIRKMSSKNMKKGLSDLKTSLNRSSHID
jgi:hypothetical protein